MKRILVFGILNALLTVFYVHSAAFSSTTSSSSSSTSQEAQEKLDYVAKKMGGAALGTLVSAYTMTAFERSFLFGYTHSLSIDLDEGDFAISNKNGSRLFIIKPSSMMVYQRGNDNKYQLLLTHKIDPGMQFANLNNEGTVIAFASDTGTIIYELQLVNSEMVVIIRAALPIVRDDFIALNNDASEFCCFLGDALALYRWMEHKDKDNNVSYTYQQLSVHYKNISKENFARISRDFSTVICDDRGILSVYKRAIKETTILYMQRFSTDSRILLRLRELSEDGRVFLCQARIKNETDEQDPWYGYWQLYTDVGKGVYRITHQTPPGNQATMVMSDYAKAFSQHNPTVSPYTFIYSQIDLQDAYARVYKIPHDQSTVRGFSAWGKHFVTEDHGVVRVYVQTFDKAYTQLYETAYGREESRAALSGDGSTLFTLSNDSRGDTMRFNVSCVPALKITDITTAAQADLLSSLYTLANRSQLFTITGDKVAVWFSLPLWIRTTIIRKAPMQIRVERDKEYSAFATAVQELVKEYKKKLGGLFMNRGLKEELSNYLMIIRGLSVSPARTLLELKTELDKVQQVYNAKIKQPAFGWYYKGQYALLQKFNEALEDIISGASMRQHASSSTTTSLD